MPEQTALVSIECNHCGFNEFAVYYDPNSQGYHVECDSCGTVFYVR